MSVALEASQPIMSIREMVGKAVEIRVENVTKQIREKAEAEYAKIFKECEDAGHKPLCPEDEAEIKRDMINQYLYYRGYCDGMHLVAHVMNQCAIGVQED